MLLDEVDKELVTFKQQVRELTHRSGGRGMQQVVGRLRSYMMGWKASLMRKHRCDLSRLMPEFYF